MAHTLPSIALVLVLLAGCSGGAKPQPSVAANPVPPGVDAVASGRTIHLKATVVDLEQEVVGNFTANLWAFCFAPSVPSDKDSAAAIQGWTPLAGDHVAGLAPGYTCSVPGPTIRVHQGDHVIVDFRHDHMHPHSIHWHGQLVPWQSDGAPGVSQDSVVAGKTFSYNFTAKKAGTLWYHCHVDSQQHIMKGLYGAFIVEPTDTSKEPKDIGREYVWILSTANRGEIMQVVPGELGHHAGHAGAPSPDGSVCVSGSQGCEEPESEAGNPDIFLINGHSFPLTLEQPETLLRIKEGERIRLRIVNAGETTETIHPHGHDMLITHRDGNVLPAGLQYYVDTLDISPGQRIDVVISGDNPGPWMIHTHVAAHETNCGRSGGGMHGMLVYEGFEHSMHRFLGTELPATCDADGAPSATAVLGRVLGQTLVAGGPEARPGAFVPDLLAPHA